MATALETNGQYFDHVDAKDSEHIALIRAAGRKAGRMLGWKVRTFQTDPARRDDKKVVVIVVVEQSTPEDEARFLATGELLLRDAFSRDVE
jgi:hypothetical protein